MHIDEIEAPGLTDEIRCDVKRWGFSELTEIQTLALQAGIANEQSQIVCAPTSSGKTLVGEIAILSTLCRGSQCLYLVSHKALADQKYTDFEERFGESAPLPRGSIGLSTGDREEGEASPRLMVATYEKALALLLSGQLDVSRSVIVADELQIIGESARGPNIETLCTILRAQSFAQFVGLTATIGNANELADWLECTLVTSYTRDVELHQEIWSGGSGYSVRFGQEQGEPCHVGEHLPHDTIEVVGKLIAMGRAPVLVFTESRNEASELAGRYSQILMRTAEGIELAEQLALFSEPTESSEQLQQNAQRRVAFHTADLTAQERQVVERGFSESKFDVCFATSTLAAGVNFPFRSVVFSKMTYQYGDREGTMILRGDYRNMSGRAGRLGLHPDGYAVLIPKTPRELTHANVIVQPENDRVESQMVRLSMRRSVLALVAFGAVEGRGRLTEFFQRTFYWHQIRERNPKKLDDVISTAIRSVDWLIDNGLIEEDFGMVFSTPVGKAVAQSGLLPTTAVKFLEVLKTSAAAIESDFDGYIPGLIHWVCGSDEFASDRPSRFLPWPAGRRPVDSAGFLRTHALLGPLDRTDNRTNQCAHAVTLFASGIGERHIRSQTNIPSGQAHRLAIDVAWVIDGLQKISSVPDLNYPQTLTNSLSMLARQVRWGAPAEALDILRVAQREGVPGFGRQRAVALLQQGIQTFDQLLDTAREKLLAVLGSDRRTSALVTAVASCLGHRPERFQRVHQDLAAKLGIGDVVEACANGLGVEYESAIKGLMELERSWLVRTLDDGRQQNVPDLMITLGDRSILLECKTTTKRPPVIKKEEAFAVLQKAIDFEPSIHRITLGKPGFDEHSKRKVRSARDITLIEHEVLIEGMLRLVADTLTAEQFVDWIVAPGLTEVDRLGGRPSYEILRGA